MTATHHHQTLLAEIQANSNPEWAEDDFKKRYHGTPHHYYGLNVPTRRQVAKRFAKANRHLPYPDWVALQSRLYGGQSYEEKAIAGELLAFYPAHRKQMPPGKLAEWLTHLEGWAEVDHTCQNNFSGAELLTRWADWQPVLAALAHSAVIACRRASLVLFVRPLREEDDVRLLNQALANLEIVRHERDVLITKAVSWVLREALNHHKETIEGYINDSQAHLPPIAVRHVRAKLKSGA